MIFQNQPKLSEYEMQKEFNERRLSLVPLIEGFITTHKRFLDKEVSVTFSDQGLGSLIAFIETGDEKLVLKIPLSKNFSDSESLFLKVWNQAGIKVPQVFEEGRLGDFSYLLMEFINASLLSQIYTPDEMTEEGLYREMGRLLRMMHEPGADGYGHAVDGRGEYLKFRDWFNGPEIQRAINYVREHDLLSDKHGSIEKAFEIMCEYVGGEGKSSYCHNDFGSSNIFATEPLTVFDPNPQFNTGYLDLGLSVVNHVSAGLSPTQLIEGYFSDYLYDKEAFNSAVLLASYLKLPSWHKKVQLDQINNIQNYLIAHSA